MEFWEEYEQYMYMCMYIVTLVHWSYKTLLCQREIVPNPADDCPLARKQLFRFSFLAPSCSNSGLGQGRSLCVLYCAVAVTDLCLLPLVSYIVNSINASLLTCRDLVMLC